MKVFTLDRSGVHILGRVDAGHERILTSFVGVFYFAQIELASKSFVRWTLDGMLEALKSTYDGNIPYQTIDGKALTTADGKQLETNTSNTNGSVFSHNYEDKAYYTQKFYAMVNDSILRYETALNINKFKAYNNEQLKEIILSNAALTHFYVENAPEMYNLYIKNTGYFYYDIETIGVEDYPLSFHQSVINLKYPVRESLLQILYLTGMPKLHTVYIEIPTLVTIEYGPNSPIKVLTIKNYKEFVQNIQNVPNLQDFSLIINPSSYLDFSKNVYLTTIYLEDMQNLRGFKWSPVMSNLTIKNCQSIVTLDFRNDIGILNLLLPDDRELIQVDVRYCAISADSQAVYNLIDSLYDRHELEVWGELIISSIDIKDQWKDFALSKGWYLLNEAQKAMPVFGLGVYPLSFHGDLIGLPAI